jgi:hypothetical protein
MPDPFPNFEYTSAAEAVAWAGSLVLAALLFGLSIRLNGPRHEYRRIGLRLVAVLLFCGACGINLQSQSRYVDATIKEAQRDRERMEELRRERERLAAPRAPPDRLAP